MNLLPDVTIEYRWDNNLIKKYMIYLIFSLMQCSKCGRKAVTYIRYNGKYLCKHHFMEFVERRVKKEIRKQGLPKGTIAVALSGGKDSSIVAYILNKILREHRERKLIAITVDEGIKGYRNETIKIAKKFCNEHEIEHHIVSFKETLGFTMDEISKKRGNMAECTYCGVFRRYVLNRAARQMHVKAIALGHNLDDVAQTILMNFVRNDLRRMARMAPHRHIQANLIPRILPLIEVPEKETMLYALLKNFEIYEEACPYSIRAMRREYQNILFMLEEKHPGTRHAILKSYRGMEDCLAAKFPPAKLQPCRICGEPSSMPVCMACQLREKLKINS